VLTGAVQAAEEMLLAAETAAHARCGVCTAACQVCMSHLVLACGWGGFYQECKAKWVYGAMSGAEACMHAACTGARTRACTPHTMDLALRSPRRPSQSFLTPPSDVEVGGQVMGKLWSSQAFTFVADHTPSNEEGLLPGLCLYTELWLSKVRGASGHRAVPVHCL